MDINKKYNVDKNGKPKEVVISLKDYKKIEELFELDLDKETVDQLQRARKDRESGNNVAYIDLDAI